MRSKMVFLTLSLSVAMSALAGNPAMQVSAPGRSDLPAVQKAGNVEQSSFQFGPPAPSKGGSNAGGVGRVNPRQLDVNSARPLAGNSNYLPRVSRCSVPNPPHDCRRPAPKH
jgi:hypothetical protein